MPRKPRKITVDFDEHVPLTRCLRRGELLTLKNRPTTVEEAREWEAEIERRTVRILERGTKQQLAFLAHDHKGGKTGTAVDIMARLIPVVMRSQRVCDDCGGVRPLERTQS